MSRPRRTALRAGFGLTEVLVSIAVATLLLSVLAFSGRLGNRPHRIQQARMAASSALRAVERRLVRDLHEARRKPVVEDQGRRLRIEQMSPGHPEVVYQASATGTVTRRAPGAAADELLLPAQVDFELLPGNDPADPDGLRLGLVARPLPDARVPVPAPGGGDEDDPRTVVRLEIRLPGYALGKPRGYTFLHEPRP